MIQVGDIIPNFTLLSDEGKEVNLTDFKGKKIVLYFYPKDLTGGCTIEANNYRDNFNEFVDNNTVVIGVSKDDIKSHQRFKEKNGLPFILLSDPELEMIKYFDLWQEKKLYGRTYMGTVRSTFILDENLKVIKINPKASPKEDAKTNLEFIKSL